MSVQPGMRARAARPKARRANRPSAVNGRLTVRRQCSGEKRSHARPALWQNSRANRRGGFRRSSAHFGLVPVGAAAPAHYHAGVIRFLFPVDAGLVGRANADDRGLAAPALAWSAVP